MTSRRQDLLRSISIQNTKYNCWMRNVFESRRRKDGSLGTETKLSSKHCSKFVAQQLERPCPLTCESAIKQFICHSSKPKTEHGRQ